MSPPTGICFRRRLIRHEGDVTLLNRRYREGVEISKAEGRAYFSIVPPKP